MNQISHVCMYGYAVPDRPGQVAGPDFASAHARRGAARAHAFLLRPAIDLGGIGFGKKCMKNVGSKLGVKTVSLR